MKYYKRGFLNEGEGMAAFECNVTYEPECRHNSVYADFSIRDCNRQVCLEFSIYEESDYQKAMFKVNSLLIELEAFKKKLQNATGEYEAAQLKFEVENEQA